jgi:hypothetical protein
LVARLLLIISIACSALVLLSFAFFATDQLGGASNHQQKELAAGQPISPGVTPPAKHHGQPRAFIDDAASKLDSPFRSLLHSNSEWVTHGIPTLLALLLYGFGLAFLARFARGGMA